jgi:hypothetical protein
MAIEHSSVPPEKRFTTVTDAIFPPGLSRDDELRLCKPRKWFSTREEAEESCARRIQQWGSKLKFYVVEAVSTVEPAKSPVSISRFDSKSALPLYPWSCATAYVKGDRVTTGGETFRCKEPHRGVNPHNGYHGPIHWTLEE